MEMASAILPAAPYSTSPSVRRPLAATSADRILEGQRLNAEANALLKADSPKQAAVLFKRCFAYTRGLLPQRSNLAQYAVAAGQEDTLIDQSQEKTVRALELACNHGLATVYLRSGQLERALSYTEQVLNSEPENVKGLFRTGQLHLKMKNIEAAKRCLTRAAKHEPRNVAIRSELRSLSRLARESGGDFTTNRGADGGHDALHRGKRRTEGQTGAVTAVPSRNISR